MGLGAYGLDLGLKGPGLGLKNITGPVSRDTELFVNIPYDDVFTLSILTSHTRKNNVASISLTTCNCDDTSSS